LRELGVPEDRVYGRQPKLTTKQQAELCRMHATGNYSITDLGVR
jgi:hypothetical protein